MLGHTSIEDGRSTILPRFEAFLSKLLVARRGSQAKNEEEEGEKEY